MRPTAPSPQPPQLPRPACALPEENAGALAAGIYASMLKELDEARERLMAARRPPRQGGRGAACAPPPRRRVLRAVGGGLGRLWRLVRRLRPG